MPLKAASHKGNEPHPVLQAGNIQNQRVRQMECMGKSKRSNEGIAGFGPCFSCGLFNGLTK
jgi:hypothetical protein